MNPRGGPIRRVVVYTIWRWRRRLLLPAEVMLGAAIGIVGQGWKAKPSNRITEDDVPGEMGPKRLVDARGDGTAVLPARHSGRPRCVRGGGTTDRHGSVHPKVEGRNSSNLEFRPIHFGSYG